MPIHPLWLVLILVIVLIIFGPGRLPELGGAVGKAMREFRKASTDLQEDIKRSSNPEPPVDTRPAADHPATDVKSPTDTKAS